MNIKRAFLAAVAVLAAPSLAMAQNTYTFEIDIDFTPNVTTTPMLPVTLTCNNGLPLSQSADVGEGAATTFVLTEADDGTICEVTLDSVPSGWSADTDHTFAALSSNDTDLEHTFAVTADKFSFKADVTWNDDAQPDASFGISMYCTGVFNGSTYVNLSTSYVSEPGSADYTWSNVGWPNPNGGTQCYLVNYSTDSSVESSVESTCSSSNRKNVGIGAGTVVCTATGTQFFEGIPTLSQYGMALMALLMLGVGFIGFRRFA